MAMALCAMTSANPPKEWRHGPYEEGPLKKPSYVGDDPLSNIVNTIISFKPLFQLMKLGARQVFIRSAEKKGLPWTKISQEILQSADELHAEKELLEDKMLTYPQYYLQEFHAYSDGNLSWQAASEAELATMTVAIRTFPFANSHQEALDVLRGNWVETIKEHHERFSSSPVINQVLDIGCSVGTSAICLAERFPSSQVIGLDLSPYFLSVAQYREKQRLANGTLKRRLPIQWLHANGENTGLPPKSLDIVSIAYVIHECPRDVTRSLLQEAFRVLKPGGTIAITDMSPKSKIFQSLPPVLFTLQKFTEPWLDEYYKLDLEHAICEAGFLHLESRLTDPRHRTVTATVPG